MKSIYLDNAAATPIDSRVLSAMHKASRLYANPSSFNTMGRLARNEIEKARAVVAHFLGARPDEIVFTSSGSEANNLALLGVAQASLQGSTLNPKKGRTLGDKCSVIISTIEHLSVLEPIAALETWGWKVYRLNVTKEGFVNPDDIKQILEKDKNVRLISIMYANNEIGTIQPIRQISKIIRDLKTENCRKDLPKGEKLKTGEKVRPLFHVDACQATGFLDMNVQRLGVDLLTFNGSKIYGPRGIGVLYVRRGVQLNPIISGGSQEQGLRAGTENTPAIVGLAKAISLIKPTTNNQQLTTLRDYTINKIQKEIPEALLVGARGNSRLPNNINICISGLESENLLLELDKYGISAGSGSACTSHAVEPSHVLKAIGVPASHINGALRFSLGRETTKKDIDYLVVSLVKIIADLKKRYARLK